jgi:hypothetical protein
MEPLGLIHCVNELPDLMLSVGAVGFLGLEDQDHVLMEGLLPLC